MNGQHHLKAEEKWRSVAKDHEICYATAERIASAIRWHLGRFTPDWPQDQDPRCLDSIDFIVHELDMDFSNRRLSEVFQRRLGEGGWKSGADFLEKEFESAAAYFQHVEGKLNNLLVFFATLLIAVITACYYIGSSEMFRTLAFTQTPRAFLVAFLLIAFAIIGLVFVGVYTELRVRKIRMLEEMAAIRGYEIEAGSSGRIQHPLRDHHGLERFAVSTISASAQRGLVHPAIDCGVRFRGFGSGDPISHIRHRIRSRTPRDSVATFRLGIGRARRFPRSRLHRIRLVYAILLRSRLGTSEEVFPSGIRVFLQTRPIISMALAHLGPACKLDRTT